MKKKTQAQAPSAGGTSSKQEFKSPLSKRKALGRPKPARCEGPPKGAKSEKNGTRGKAI